MANFVQTKALTFDLFGTILDLGGSLTPFIAEALTVSHGADVSPDEFWIGIYPAKQGEYHCSGDTDSGLSSIKIQL